MSEETSKQEEKKVTKTKGKVSSKFKGIIDEISHMSVLDLSELVTLLEDKFGVSAQAPIPVITQAPGVGDSAAAEEKSSFTVELTSAGGSKIGVIKAIREITELGLKDAKDLVDAAPKQVKENIAKEEAEAIKKKLEEVGATVALK